MTQRAPAPLPRPRTVADAIETAGQALHERRLDEAERLARYVLRSNAANVDAVRILGHCLLQQGRFAEAADALQRPAQRTRSPELEALQARALAKSSRRGEAVALLQMAVTRRPPFPLAFLQLAELHDEEEAISTAAGVLEEGLALCPGEPILLMGLGYHHLRWGDRAAARRHFAAVHQLQPDRTDALLALAQVLGQEGEHAAAAALYERALVHQPWDGLSRIALAKCLLELGRRQEGEAQLRTAVRVDPRLWGLASSAQASVGNGRLFLRPSRAQARLRSGA
jgi:tetratricopeptide (TPR) repeat protein